MVQFSFSFNISTRYETSLVEFLHCMEGVALLYKVLVASVYNLAVRKEMIAWLGAFSDGLWHLGGLYDCRSLNGAWILLTMLTWDTFFYEQDTRGRSLREMAGKCEDS